MLPTESAGWNALQAFKSRLPGRLARFKRGISDDSRPDKSQNDAAFFETDLRYIFTTAYATNDLSEYEYYEMHQKALNLLTSLESMVNKDLIEPWRKPNSLDSIEPFGGHETSLHGIAISGITFPHLSALISFIDASSDQFNLINGPGITLFTLPHGEPGRLAIERLSDWKKVLVRLTINTRYSQNSRFFAFNQDEASPEVEIGTKSNQRQENASAVIDAMLREFRQSSCKEVHEIKLKVPDEWQSGECQSALDMFVSSGPGGDLWQETQYGPFQVGVSGRRSICAAIERAMAQKRKLYLFLDEEGLFDISDQLPPKASSSENFMVESLGQLLDQKVFTKITHRDYLEGTINAKMRSSEKAVLALGLAKCLMNFFDGEADLASSSWKPDTIDFIRSSGTDANDRKLHIRLKPYIASPKPADVLKTIGPGNPTLLSFAKLLLEIESGEKLPIDIHSNNRENVIKWGEMCGFVNAAGMEGDGDYIRAVEGCLYLHMALPKPNRDAKASHSSGEILKKAIYEQIVKNLELTVNPQTSKRKREDSISELPLSKKLSIIPSSLSDEMPQEMMSRHPTYRASDFTRPRYRHDFEFAIVCALPLEYNAVSLLFDEFWDEDCDYYGRAHGDLNAYTTGRIGKVNVVLVLSNKGKVAAASTSASLRSSYPNLRLVLVSGICGGVPSPTRDEELILGDVIISKCVVQYDLGRQNPNGFKMYDTVDEALGRAPKSIRNLLDVFETNRARDRLEKKASDNLQQIQYKAAQKPRGAKYLYPGACEDRLFQSDYIHKNHHSSQCLCTRKEATDVSICQTSQKLMCEDLGCDIKHLVQRKRLESKRTLEERGHFQEAQAPSIFVGRIGSGDTVLKCGKERDRIAKQHEIIAFEMEGAGVWDEVPCIIVKAACDYADSHKNKIWQDFAAATAASVTKALLEMYIR